jgi:hypothetical protein
MDYSSTIKVIDAYVTEFASILRQYRKNPIENTLMMNRRTYGGVRITLIFQERLGLKTEEAKKELVTPPQFDKIGVIGVLWGSLHRPVSSIDVITKLYKKIIGQQCPELEEVQSLYTVVKAASPHVQQEVIRELSETCFMTSIVKILQRPPLASAVRQLFIPLAQSCRLFPAQEAIPLRDEKLMSLLWAVRHQTQAPDSRRLSEAEILQLIMEGNDDEAYFFRAVAIGMCHEIAEPIQKLVERLFGDLIDGTWINTVDYCIMLEGRLAIIQKWHMQLHVDELPEPQLTLEWTISVSFDNRFCPHCVKCKLNTIQGPLHNLRETVAAREEILMAQLSVEWNRTLTGDIEALFLHPNPEVFSQSSYLSPQQCPIQCEEAHLRDDRAEPPQFALLKRYIEQGRKEVDHIAFIQSDRVPFSLAGTLIAVSTLPVQAIGSHFQKNGLAREGVWTHTTDVIRVAYEGLNVIIVRQGRSSRNVEGQSAESHSWTLKLKLSASGYPESIDFWPLSVPPTDQSVLPPPHPVQQADPAPAATAIPAARVWIPVPLEGIEYNNSPLDARQGADAIDLLLSCFDIHNSRPLQITTPQKLRKWLCSTDHPCASAIRACITSCSPLSLAALAEFVTHLHPTREGEHWDFQELKYAVVVNREDQVLEIRRKIRCTCRYEYIDVLHTKQSRLFTTGICELKTTCNINGIPRKSQISCLEWTDIGSSEPSEQLQRRMHREWNAPLACNVAEILHDPSHMSRSMRFLLAMQPIKVLKEGWALLDTPDLNGMVFVTQWLPLPQSISSEDQLQEHLIEMGRRCNAWHTFMRHLGLSEDFRCNSSNNKDAFSRAFERCREEVGVCLRLLERTTPLATSTGLVEFRSEATGSVMGRTISDLSLQEANAKLMHWEQLLKDIGIPWARTAQCDEELLFKRWEQYSQEHDISLKLMVLDLAGSPTLRSAVHQHIEHAESSLAALGMDWRHQPEKFEVNLLDGGNMEITIQGYASRIDHENIEVAGIQWAMVFRLCDGSLATITTSVQEIQAPGLLSSHVAQILTHFNSTWTHTPHNTLLIPLLPISPQSDPRLPYSCDQYLLRFPTESICDIHDLLPYFRDIMFHSLSTIDIASCIKQVETALLNTYLADGSHPFTAEPLSTHHTHRTELVMEENGQFTVSHRMVFTCFGISHVGDKEALKFLKTVSWGIDIQITGTGSVRSVKVINSNEVMTEPLKKEFRTILGTDISFEQVSPSTTFLPEGST